jgi:hypothetical protein
VRGREGNVEARILSNHCNLACPSTVYIQNPGCSGSLAARRLGHTGTPPGNQWQRREESFKQACLTTPAGVPTFSSRCIGTTHPRCPRRSTGWLPRWRTCTKPSRPSTETQSLPLILGSLGMLDLEGRHQWSAASRKRNLLEAELSCFLEILLSLRHVFPRGSGAGLGVERNVTTLGSGSQKCGQNHAWRIVSSRTVSMSAPTTSTGDLGVSSRECSNRREGILPKSSGSSKVGRALRYAPLNLAEIGGFRASPGACGAQRSARPTTGAVGQHALTSAAACS